MGKCIGRNKKVGDIVQKESIDKTFNLSSPLNDYIKGLLESMPDYCIDIVKTILSEAQLRFNRELHSSAFIALADHLYHAFQRAEKGDFIRNSLLWEIKKNYPDEYFFSLETLPMIKARSGYDLPEDEAGFIALHLVNAQHNGDMRSAIQVTHFMKDMITLVECYFSIVLKEDTLVYQRFITHLRFFALRVLEGDHKKTADEALCLQIRQDYPAASHCAERIRGYVKTHYKHVVTNGEVMFLTIHIQHLLRHAAS